MKYILFALLIVIASCKNNSGAKGEVALAENRPTKTPSGMVYLQGGVFTMGSSEDYAENDEGPEILVKVDPFFMDVTEVTNAEFEKFVQATGYETVAERAVNWEELKKDLPSGTQRPHDSILRPGSLLFTPPQGKVELNDYTQWWSWRTGADWRHPYGPGSSITEKQNHPVVHIAYEDAVTYAEWSGKRLPTEAEWEYASKDSNSNTQFAWGDELTPNGNYLANYFQGDFPYNNTLKDGFGTTAPVKSFAPNTKGLYDMIGNVWEWTSDWYRPDAKKQYSFTHSNICSNPKGPEESYDPTDPYAQRKRVVKGGSFLCSEQYCSNYRPSSRIATSTDSGQNHTGFRCVMDLK